MNEKLLEEFSTKEGAKESAITDAETALQCSLPLDYKEFLEKINGGEGFIGENYLILWTAEELAQFNRDYQVEDYAPGLILFGSDGGGEGYAFDTRIAPMSIVQVPFIGMNLAYARAMAPSFSEFITTLAK